jgi:hypothetical protein
MIQLPSDHTRGATPDVSPQAMVADNDLALGQIVESPFGLNLDDDEREGKPRR